MFLFSSNLLVQEILAQGVEHAFSLAVLGEYLYWSDWSSDRVMRASKWTGSQTQVLHGFGYFTPLAVLAFYNDTCKPFLPILLYLLNIESISLMPVTWPGGTVRKLQILRDGFDSRLEPIAFRYSARW